VILGLLSDTHGREQRTACALDLLERLGAEAFVHCGDIGGEGVLDEFAGRRTWFVWGNTDAADPGLERYAASLGLSVPRTSPVQLELAGRVLVVYHGHEAHFHRLMRRLETRDRAAFEQLTRGWDYILYGHTHCAADTRVGHVRLINPGALERARPHTVATLDLARDVLEFWGVDERAEPSGPPLRFQPR
jgi:putative phosphoesterase